MRLARAPLSSAIVVSAIAVAAVTAWPGRAISQTPAPGAPPDKEACAVAHEDAQIFRKKGRLLEAKKKLELCAEAACPLLARQDCAVWIVEVDERLPTITLAARDKQGKPTTAVRCTLDGQALVDGLDAKPLPINPGAHALKCDLDGDPGATPVEQSLAVVEGEKGRKVEITFEPTKPPEPAPSASASAAPSASIAIAPPPPSASAAPPFVPARASTKPIAYTLAGVAAVGVIGFTYFGLTGISDENALRSSCKPSCKQSDVDSVTTRYHVADISLGVGLVAAAFAAWFYLSDTSAPAPPVAGAPQSGARLRVGVQAAPGGGGASVGVSF